MARKRGRCDWCGERRALTAGVCDACIEQERFGREQHEDFQNWLNERDHLRSALERTAGDLAETIWRGKPDRAQNEATLEIARAALEK